MMLIMVFAAACSKGNNGDTSPSASSPPASTPDASTSGSPEASSSDTDGLDLELKDNGPVTLRLMWWAPDPEKWKEELTGAFTAKYPWIKIEMVQHDINNIPPAIAAGEPIDLFWNSDFWKPYASGFIEDLTPYIEADSEFQSYNFNPGLLETFQFNGRQWGLSRGNDINVIYYNKDLLARYGMEPPKNDWTYEDMREMAKKATDINAKTYGFQNNDWAIKIAPGVKTLADGVTPKMNALNDDMTKLMLDPATDTAVYDNFDWWLELITKDGSMLGAQASKDAGFEGVDLWNSGQALFSWFGSFALPGFSDPENGLKFDWDIAPIPAGTSSQPTLAWNNGIFMGKASKHKAEAWALMKFMTANKEVQKKLMDLGGSFPNSPDQDLQDHFKNEPFFTKINKDALLYAANHSVYDPTFGMVGGNVVSWTIQNAGIQMFHFNKSAYDYMAEVYPGQSQALADAYATAAKVTAEMEANKK